MSTDTNYPSEFIDPKKKNDKRYCMQYARAFEKNSQLGRESNLFINNIKEYDKRRKFGEGKQDPDTYMKQVGVKSGKSGKSWKVLDTSILPVAPKFIELLIGKVISKGYDNKGFRKTIVRGIDRKSAEEQREFKTRLSEQVINKGLIQELQAKGIEMPSNTDGTPVPQNLQEVDTYAEIFRKDEYAIEAKDAMLTWFDANDFEQSMYEFIDDIIKLSDGGMWTDLDQNGNVKIRRGIPERMRTNKCKFKDSRDLFRVGEYIEVTVSELREMWPGQKESVYREVVNQQLGERRYGEYSPSFDDGYPYDNERVTIFHCRWLSTDTWKHVVEKNKFGAKKISRKPFNFPTSHTGQAIKLDDYKKRHPNKEVIPTTIKNVYQCKWLVGTNHCFDHGLMNNIQRTKNSLYGANLGVFLYHMTNNIVDKIIPIINMIQVAWLQHQNHVARSKPSGVSIEMSAMESLSAGKNKDALSIKEAMRMYFDTGVLFWRRKNFNSASNQWRPIDSLPNDSNSEAENTLGYIFKYIGILRDILGINEVEDASTPNPEILKGVAEMAALGTKHVLKDLYHGVRSVYLKTAKSVIDMTPDARQISKHKGFENALGAKSDKFWKELQLREMGIFIEEELDPKKREVLESAVLNSEKAQIITPDEAADILMDDNILRASQQLRDKIKMRQRENEEAQMRLSEKQAQDNAAAAQAAAEAEKVKIDAQKEADKEVKTHEISEMIRFEDYMFGLKKKEKMLDKDIEAEKREDEQDHDLDLAEVEIEGKKEIEKSKPKPTMAPMGKK